MYIHTLLHGILFIYLIYSYFDGFNIYRFNPEFALKKLRGKRLLFVGDSLQRGQWQSFVCMVESIIPEDKKSMRRGRSLSVFKAKVSTIDFCKENKKGNHSFPPIAFLSCTSFHFLIVLLSYSHFSKLQLHM